MDPFEMITNNMIVKLERYLESCLTSSTTFNTFTLKTHWNNKEKSLNKHYVSVGEKTS